MKTSQSIKRLKARKNRQAIISKANAINAEQAEQKLTAKQAESILIDVSLKELYNNGEKRELEFVEQILQPNSIQIPDGEALESFFDILTNTGLMKTVIGFGKHGKIALTQEGFQLMNKYGSYCNFLNAKNRQPNLERDTDVEPITPQAPPAEPMDGAH
jgi:hypothetical protein